MDNPPSPYTLKATRPLNGYTQTWLGLKIAEAPARALCSLTVSSGREQAFQEIFTTTYNMDIPAPNVAAQTDTDLIFWTGPNQWFVETSDHDSYSYDLELRKIFLDTASITLQSDAWVEIEVSGNNTPHLFERLLLIDMSCEAFPAGRIARTSMHHMNTIILHNPLQEGHYKLYCAKSYARSFLHSLTHAAETITALAS